MYLILGVVLSFGSFARAAANKSTNNKALLIGSYRIVETTRLYPKPNYYDQMLDCSPTVSPNPFQALSSGPTINPSTGGDSLLPGIINDPGSTIGIGNGSAGTGSSVGGAVNDNGSGTGVIGLDPVSGGNGNSGIGTSTGGIYVPPPSYNDPMNPTGLTLDKIVNIGNVIWSIIEMGRPNVRVQSYRAHALPKGIACWTDLENWQIPVSKVFSVEYKNKLGQVVAVYSYRISYVYGGNVDGVGKYIANLTVTPVDMRVSWGFNFSSQVQIPATFNVGSKNNPTAGMQVFVFWSIGNALKVEQRSSLFFVAGDGRIQLTESK